MNTLTHLAPAGNPTGKTFPSSLSVALDLAAWEVEHHLDEAERAAEAFEHHVEAYMAAQEQRRRLEAMMCMQEIA